MRLLSIASLLLGTACSGGGGLSTLTYSPTYAPPMVSEQGSVFSVNIVYNPSDNTYNRFLRAHSVADSEVRFGEVYVGKGQTAPPLTVAPDGMVPFGGEGNLQVFDSSLGVHYELPLGQPILSPIAVGGLGRMYWVDAAGIVHCVTPSGDELWAAVNDVPVANRPAIDRDGRVFVLGGYVDQPAVLAGFDSDGARLFSVQVPTPTDNLAIGDGGRIFVTHLRGVTAYDIDGTELWEWQGDTTAALAPVVLRNGDLVVSAGDRVVILDAEDGRQKKEGSDVGALGPVTVGSDGNLYGGCEEGLCVLNDNGKLNRTIATAGLVYGAPVLWDGYLIAMVDGDLGLASYGLDMGGSVSTEPSTWARPNGDNGNRSRQP